jgi:drug/metabolite transporter (DMT)-like permease
MVKSRLLILAAAVLWSTAGAVMKSCALSGWQIAGGRSLVAAIFLFLVLPGGRRLPSLPVLLTSVAYAATVVLFALANKLTTAANAIFLQDTAPLWVLLFSRWLLGERPQRSALWSVPVFALGLCLFFVDELSPGQLAGNVVALASGVAFAFCIVGLRRSHVSEPSAGAPRAAQDGADGSAASLITGNAIAALVTLPFWFSGPSPRAPDLFILLYLGIFQLGLAYVCFARGMAHTSALEASLLALLEPVLNPIWTFLVVGERPGTWALTGAAIILMATVWRTVAPLLARNDAAPAL